MEQAILYGFCLFKEVNFGEPAEIDYSISSRAQAFPKAFSVKRSIFCGDVKFGQCTYNGTSLWSDAVFKGKLDCSRCIFNFGLSFMNAKLGGISEFTNVRCNGPAYFWRTQFADEVDFRHMLVKRIAHDFSPLFAGEANFSFAKFSNVVSFERAAFEGRTFFHRSIFLEQADFNGSRFEENVYFEGGRAEYALSISEDSGDDSIYDELLRRGVLFSCSDRDIYTIVDFLADNLGGGEWNAKTSVHLVNQNEPFRGWAEKTKEKYIELQNRYGLPTFSLQSRTDFRGVEFSKRAVFAKLDLSGTRFQGMIFEDIRFIDVTWSRAETTRGDKQKVWKRAILADEIESDRDLRALAVNYHDLRLVHQRAGDLETARDFYYGELLMRYEALPRSTRWFSLLGIYKALSGFGRQERKAFAWLVFFVAVLFPILFAIADGENGVRTAATLAGSRGRVDCGQNSPKCLSQENGRGSLENDVDSQSKDQGRKGQRPEKGNSSNSKEMQIAKGTASLNTSLRSVIHSKRVDLSSRHQHAAELLEDVTYWELESLEACTFISHPANQASRHRDRLVAGFERLCVAIQTTLFFLALKWKFERYPGSS